MKKSDFPDKCVDCRLIDRDEQRYELEMKEKDSKNTASKAA
jgi:hypothetical protein